MFALTDTELAVTCIADEAANQPYEGKVAVGCVILNRQKLRYASDGTLLGTVLHKWAFSGFWAQMVHGAYKQTQFDLAGAETLAAQLHAEFSRQAAWADCARAWVDAIAWSTGRPLSFNPGPAFAGLTPRTVLYLNPKVSSAPWATPAALDAVIFQHSFFHDGTVH
ncbi:MAG TPA: hypothetical protein VGG29_03545 [Caulobacteraceae bacterium]|jgi:hypothetical protein